MFDAGFFAIIKKYVNKVALGQGAVQGPPGPQGPQGPSGETGPQGVQGVPGPQGPEGQQGPVGATGPKGDQGIQGPEGQQGGPGPQGIQGSQGDTGPAGSAGDQGPQGVQGDPGPAGPPSNINPRGIWDENVTDYERNDVVIFDDGINTHSYIYVSDTQGLIAAPNDTVTPWVRFVMQGPSGIQGPQGLKGDAGAKGENGPAGPQGVQGISGSDGKSAYQIWLSKGNTGTEDDFLESLRGQSSEEFIGQMAVLTPDYARTENVNRINANNGTWTANKPGFVVCSGNGNPQFQVKGKTVFALTGSLAATHTFPVRIGDIVKISAASDISCYFIPPCAVGLPTLSTFYPVE